MEEIFARTLKLVSETTDVPEEIILSKDRHEDVVDARMTLIYLLHLQGLYPLCISRMTGLCKRAVNHCISRFTERKRCRKYLGLIYETTRNILGIKP